MRRAVRSLLLGAALAALAGPRPAHPAPVPAPQEGHPLTGTWTGDWGPEGGPRTHLTVVMSWDGKAVGGLINPGPNAIPLTRVSTDWSRWTVTIEAAGTDAASQAGAVRAEGRLEDIGSSGRRLEGTWTQGQTTGDFSLRRE